LLEHAVDGERVDRGGLVGIEMGVSGADEE
jgi:hypothetical protein